jgi:hypothetical protein
VDDPEELEDVDDPEELEDVDDPEELEDVDDPEELDPLDAPESGEPAPEEALTSPPEPDPELPPLEPSKGFPPGLGPPEFSPVAHAAKPIQKPMGAKGGNARMNLFMAYLFLRCSEHDSVQCPAHSRRRLTGETARARACL